MQTQIVEVLINVTQDEDSKIHDGKPKFSGEYVMRALNAAGAVLHEARLTVRDLDVPTSDYARLLTLRAALERLHSKLRGGIRQGTHCVWCRPAITSMAGCHVVGSAILIWSRNSHEMCNELKER